MGTNIHDNSFKIDEKYKDDSTPKEDRKEVTVKTKSLSSVLNLNS